MPGVPPDAMAQVKKGLKGLFSRKKKDKHQSIQPAAQQSAPAAVSQAAPQLAPISQDPATTAGNEYPPKPDVSGADPVHRIMAEDEAVPGLKASDSSVNPTAPHTSIPQISEPTTVSESKNIDLNLVSSIPEATEAGSSTIAKETQDTTKEISKLDTKPPAEGMSATSGPLSDDLVAGYGGSPVEKHMRAAHAEKRAQMAETGEGPTTDAEESQV